MMFFFYSLLRGPREMRSSKDSKRHSAVHSIPWVEESDSTGRGHGEGKFGIGVYHPPTKNIKVKSH